MSDLQELTGKAADFYSAREHHAFGRSIGQACDFFNELVHREELDGMPLGILDLPHTLKLALGLSFQESNERSGVREPKSLRFDVALAHLDARTYGLENAHQEVVAGLYKCTVGGGREEVLSSQMKHQAMDCDRDLFFFVFLFIESLTAVLIDFPFYLTSFLLCFKCKSSVDGDT